MPPGAGAAHRLGAVILRAAVKFLWREVCLMNNTLDVILVNRRNQSDDFRTVLPVKMYVRVLLILMLAAAAMLVVGAASGAAATTRYVDGGGGADYDTIQGAVDVAGAGDTIYVYDGIYNEHVVISTSITFIRTERKRCNDR